mgnify:CR=1 FL=1
MLISVILMSNESFTGKITHDLNEFAHKPEQLGNFTIEKFVFDKDDQSTKNLVKH